MQQQYAAIEASTERLPGSSKNLHLQTQKENLSHTNCNI